MAQSRSLRQTLEALPASHATSTILRKKIKDQLSSTKSTPILVVLDDDPTGTQTCHDINVLTTWSTSVLVTELASTPAGSGFFILTNSRALHPDGAQKLIEEICSNLKEAAQQAGKDVEVVLRGDSTLRGHFPLEPEAVESVLGKSDVWLLAPFFLQGGRYTIEDVHYVAEGDTLVPVRYSILVYCSTADHHSACRLEKHLLLKTRHLDTSQATCETGSWRRLHKAEGR